MKSNIPVHVIVFGVLTINSDIRAPFIFAHGHGLKTKVFIKYVEEVVLLWIERMTGRSCFRQQSCVIPHKQEGSVMAMKKFCDHNNPDYNPLDYYVRYAIL